MEGTTVGDLLITCNENYEKMWNSLKSIPLEKQEAAFEALGIKKEEHSQQDKSCKDVLIHIYKWNQLLLQWVQKNQVGTEQSFGKWCSSSEMIVEIKNISLQQTKDLVKQSHKDVLNMLKEFSNEEVFVKKTSPYIHIIYTL